MQHDWAGLVIPVAVLWFRFAQPIKDVLGDICFSIPHLTSFSPRLPLPGFGVCLSPVHPLEPIVPAPDGAVDLGSTPMVQNLDLVFAVVSLAFHD